MWPEGVVLQAPAIGQTLGFSHRGEQLGVEEFIPLPDVKRFGKVVLPLRFRFDVARHGLNYFAPAPEGVGNDLELLVRRLLIGGSPF